MPEIKQLSPHVADLIAAGEVVERPASVVKELVENAIDAGAGAVTVEIEHGGMTLIRVTDNGCGIPAREAATAFLRHATSKISTEYDLEAIGTLGFRGEALAAISAVSRIDLLTKTADASLGCALTLEGGRVVEQEEAGCPDGTTMVVRDLFYNTPARLKFTKKDAAEGAAVFAAVQRLALSHPELSVKFIRDGRQELLTPGDGQLKSAVYSVLGRDLALGFTEARGSGEDMSVSGFVSIPACCRGSRSYQHFFVNGRYVKNRTMMAALEEAYQNQKMVGRFPGCVLHLTVRPNRVDVNVHPAKTEVKFLTEQAVFDAVYYGVLTALNRTPGRPDLGFLGMVPLTAIGLVLVPAVRTSRAHRVRGVVDGLMVACSLLLISWILVLGPRAAAGATDSLELAVLMAYPGGDIVLLTVALYTLALRRRAGQDSAALALIGAGLGLIGLTDTAYGTDFGDRSGRLLLRLEIRGRSGSRSAVRAWDRSFFQLMPPNQRGSRERWGACSTSARRSCGRCPSGGCEPTTSS